MLSAMMNRRTVRPRLHSTKVDHIVLEHMPPTATSSFQGVAKQSVPAYRSNLSDSQKFGKRLAELRMDRDLTQMQLAIAAGRDRSFISDLERGVKSPTIDTLRVIADAFVMSISELVRGI